MTLKFTEELCAITILTMKNNAKFEEKLTCNLKTDRRNLINFYSSFQKPKAFALKLAPFTKLYHAWAQKSAEELCLMALKIDAKFEGKLTCGFKMT